jgi:uncharacterized membrane protein HdeD (DUF308 family)
MFGALAVNWVFLVLRASIAMMFGTIAVVWPGLTSVRLFLLFGAYVLSDGVLALCVALSVKGLPGFGSLLFESLVRIAIAIVVFESPAFAALTLVDVVAAWAVLSGLAALAVAVALRRDLSGEWPLPLAGAVSLVAGGMLVVGPGAPPDLQWVIGPYAILFGGTLLALGLRLRQLAFEIAS